jgi:hypothetical protein
MARDDTITQEYPAGLFSSGFFFVINERKSKMLTPMMAWARTQEIGRVMDKKERHEIIAELYKKLEGLLKAEITPADYKIDGVVQAIHEWSTKTNQGPYLYAGIRADFAQFAGDSPDESFDDLTSRLMV